MDLRDSARGAFDLLAEEYARLRRSGFDEVERLVLRGEYSIVCDAGAGPGTYFRPLASVAQSVIMLDLSRVMTSLGWQRALGEGRGWGSHPIACDVSCLPLRDNLFDLTISIAVLHHLSIAMAGRALKELERVTSAGNTVFLSVWSTRAMDKVDFEYLSEGVSIVRWGTPAGSVARHYVRWDPKGLKDLLVSSGIRYFDVFVSGRNIFALAEKV